MLTKNNIHKIGFSLMGSIVLLGSLFISKGYVLTLDMVFGPVVNFNIVNGGLYSALPFKYALAVCTYFLGGWITQKILLITIFFLIFYIPLIFFNRIFKFESTYGAEYVAATFFAINPFVYERFLAGQWAVIFGYVLILPVFSYATQFCRGWDWRNGFRLLISLIALGAVSTHIFVMLVLIVGILISLRLFSVGINKKSISRIAIFMASLFLCSSYWIVPAFLGKGSGSLPNFDSQNWQVFSTVGDPSLGGVGGNVLSLYGFWEEREEWIQSFVLPKDNYLLCRITLLLFLSVIVLGIFVGIKERNRRKIALLIFGTGFAGYVFSVGINDNLFGSFNLFMFQHISFWSGFRDSQKWSSVLALSYSLFAGVGAQFLASKLKLNSRKKILILGLSVIPLLYTPTILFGFMGQLHTADYPMPWSDVNKILKTNNNCKALFLPWHEYYSLKFNKDLLTANPSKVYFNCDISSGMNMELGSIDVWNGYGNEYYDLESLITSNTTDPDFVIDTLKSQGFNYIIFTKDIVDEDKYYYPFLRSNKIKKIYANKGIDLYGL